MEVGSGLGHDARRTRPADVLVHNWKPAAFDITVTSPLTLHEAPSVTSGLTAQVAETEDMPAMMQSDRSLGVCVCLWQSRFTRLAIRSNCCKSQASSTL